MPRRVRVTGIKGARKPTPLIKVPGVAPGSFLTTRMPKFSMQVKGVRAFENKINKLIKNSESSLGKAVAASTKIIAKEAQRITRVGPYKAYATGRMSNAIMAQVEEIVQDMVKGVAGVFGVDYAVYVHEGTGVMEARPFLLLAAKRKKRLVENIIRKALLKDMAKGLV